MTLYEIRKLLSHEITQPRNLLELDVIRRGVLKGVGNLKRM